MSMNTFLSADHRRRLISVVMLAILLLVVAAAWLLVAGRGAGRTRGASILADIRAQGLAAFWGAEAKEQWYLSVDSSGQAAGWRRATRRPAHEGYIGGEQVYLADGTQWRERWQLNADATSGEYRSAAILTKPRPLRIDAEMILRDGVVRAGLARGGEYAQAGAPAPANYAPEGVLDLALRLAAEGGRAVSLETIFTSIAVRGGRVHFSPLHVEPAGPGAVRVRYSAAGYDRLYRFDDHGEVAEIEDHQDGSVWRAVSRQEVIEHFSEAGTIGAPGAEPPRDGEDEQEEDIDSLDASPPRRRVYIVPAL